MWEVDERALEEIAIGAGVLGTGGGGNPYYGRLQTLWHLRAGARIQVVEPDEVPDNATCVCLGTMGAPTIGIERVLRGDEPLTAMRALERHTGARIEYLVPWEIGGSNSTQPLVQSARTGLPVVDADTMGRAFPELQMCTVAIYGVPCAPAALGDYRGNSLLFPAITDAGTLERYARAVTVRMGGSAGFAFPLMDGATMRRATIPRTLSLTRQIGRAILAAREAHDRPVETAAAAAGGQVLFRGKVVDLQRRMSAGFARGHLVLEGLEHDRGTRLWVEFQNENLIARRGDEVIAVVPDLISLVDLATAEPTTTEVVRYGLRVAVLGIPAPALLKTSAALRVVGPGAFGYPDVEFRPLPGTYGELPNATG